MTTPRYKIVNVDDFGFLGRDHHPHKEDIGQIVTMLKAEAIYFNHEMGMEAPVLDEDDGLFADGVAVIVGNGDHRYEAVLWFYTCLTDDGRILTLLDYEVEVASVSPENDQSRPAITVQPAEDHCSAEPLGIPQTTREPMPFDFCPSCAGELDTGWECNKCHRDWMPVANKINPPRVAP